MSWNRPTERAVMRVNPRKPRVPGDIIGAWRVKAVKSGWMSLERIAEKPSPVR